MATISGNAGDDRLKGNPGESSSIAGNSGNDVIRGRGKSDLLLGGKGDDSLFGANGHDDLFGGAGDDELFGGNGGDVLSGDRGSDTLNGGNGNDTFVINPKAIDAGDVDVIQDFDFNRDLRKMTFTDTLEFTNVSGQAFELRQEDGFVAVAIDGQKVADIFGASADEVAQRIEFTGGTPSSTTVVDSDGDPIPVRISGGPKDDTLEAVPGLGTTIAGNAGNDLLLGRGRDDFLIGNNGNDELRGANGHDTLYGGGDDDLLIGGNGGDWLQGDIGNDILTGGNGNDDFVLATNKLAQQGTDTITDYGNGMDDILVKGDEARLEVDQSGSDVLLTYDGTLIGIVENTTTGSVADGLDFI